MSTNYGKLSFANQIAAVKQMKHINTLYMTTTKQRIFLNFDRYRIYGGLKKKFLFFYLRDRACL